jgi:arylsulfatase A-like enzyme
MRRAAVALLAAALAACGGGPATDEGNGKPDPWRTAGGHRALVVGESLEMNLRVPADDALPERPRLRAWRLAEGWARPTVEGVWAIESVAALDFAATPAPNRQLVLEIRPYHGLDGDQQVTLRLNGSDLGVHSLVPRWQRVQTKVPDGVLQETGNRLELEFSRIRTPADAGMGPDTRPLAAFLRRVAVLPADVDRLEARNHPGARVVDDAWEVQGPGRLLLPVLADRAFDTIELEVPPPGGVVRVRSLGDDAESVEVEGPTGASLSLRLPMPTAQVVLEMAVADGTVRLPRPRIHMTKGTKRTPDRGVGTGPPKDVIVLILDAMRADSTGFAGHHRDTTPNIDAVAAGASVFTRVTAQAPYTVCSVPTMLTGVGFHSHLVQSNSGRLSAAETTLAEVLAGIGYQTLGFSATPNNSPRVGTGQGYEVFDDVWRTPDFATAIDPHVMADRVKAALDGLDERPLHLMVHWVPPHGPYTPAQRFRLWSDPDYRGPCDGSQDYLLSVMDYPEKVSDDDLREMVALYDANLLAADDALGQVIEALRHAGRWDDALVIITSDHGEAFYEHGRQGHNSTIYEEMLRVPLVVKRPGQTEGEVSDRLVSLEDLVPTILAEVDVASPDRVVGVDAFGKDDRSTVLLRSTRQQRLTGLRWRDHKVIADRFRSVDEVYDLEADPEERHNLFAHDPGLATFLMALWDRQVNRQPPPLEAEKTAITDDERSMLEALGYTE